MKQRRHRRDWLPVAVAGALALSAGCAQAPVAQAPGPDAAHALAGAKFGTMMLNGKLVCSTCQTELNSQGRHKMANLLVKNLQFLKSGEALKAAPAKPGELTLKQSVLIAMAKLGMVPSEGHGISAPADPYAAVSLMPDYVATYPEAQAYVAANPYGCCIPDGNPAPDPPF